MPLDVFPGTNEHLNIRRIAIVDDQQAVRDAWEETILDLDSQPVPIDGGLPRIVPEIVPFLKRRADALLCDHHIQGPYSPHNGAPLVADCYKQRWPALLCTRWGEPSAEEIRRYRRFIPVLLHPDRLDPAIILEGFKICIGEFFNRFSANRRPWRALINVERQIKDDTSGEIKALDVSVVGWSSDVVRVPRIDIPDPVWARYIAGSEPDFLYAHVNLGAEDARELYFDSWEAP
jgi:hypothetical protein